MTERTLLAWNITAVMIVAIDLVLTIAFTRGGCSAWLKRNTHRFVTILFGIKIFLHDPWYLIISDIFIVLFGVITWNYPKDDGSKRRRRKQEHKKERLPPNWSGIPEGA